jgi:hypothetical protein
MKGRKVGPLDLERATHTWIGHGLVGLLMGLGMALFMERGFMYGTVLAALYFSLHREMKDKLNHLLHGDYDTPQYKEGITPRVDRVGDMLGPIALALGAIGGTLLS